MSKLNELLSRIIIDEKKTIKVARAFATIEGYSDKEVNETLKEIGIGKGKRVSFASEYYDWLAEAIRSRDEAEAYIMGEGEYGETSENVQKHLSHYLNIWELSERIWASK